YLRRKRYSSAARDIARSSYRTKGAMRIAKGNKNLGLWSCVSEIKPQVIITTKNNCRECSMPVKIKPTMLVPRRRSSKKTAMVFVLIFVLSMSIDFSTIIQNTNNVPTAEMRLIMNGVYISRIVLVKGARINGQMI